jgi:hypothetical protein
MKERAADMTLRFVAAVAMTVSACGSGAGPLATAELMGRDNPGTTRDPPPETRDTPGASCIVCDVPYQCNAPLQSGAPTFPAGGTSIELSTSDGTCQRSLIDLVCSGTLFNATSCTGGGGDAFTCGSTSCAPTNETTTANTPTTGVPGTAPSAGGAVDGG